MKRYLSIFSVFLISFYFSQSRTIDVKIITQDNDTLNTKMSVQVNLFTPTLIYGSSFNEKVKIIGEDEKKSKIEASKIKELSFVDLNGKMRHFINKSEDKKRLLERIYEGEVLEWYRNYYSTSMGGGENSNDFLYNKKSNKGIGFIYFTGIPKKKLKEFFKDEPSMEGVIDEGKSAATFDEGMLSILLKYEELKLKSN